MEMLKLARTGPKTYMRNIEDAAMRQESSRREIAHYMRHKEMA